jgi:hypothetical protein
MSKTTDMKEMERNVRECLDNVPHVQIQRWASFSSDSGSNCHFYLICHPSDTQTVRLISSAPTVKGWPVWKQPGQTANTMAIAHCHQIWLWRWKTAWEEVQCSGKLNVP